MGPYPKRGTKDIKEMLKDIGIIKNRVLNQGLFVKNPYLGIGKGFVKRKQGKELS